MKKYLLDLPNGKRIKYRVTQRTDKWTLIEAVIDEDILAFLNHFATVGENSETAPIKSQDAPSTAPSDAPPKEETKPATDFTEEQKKKMIEVKNKLGIKDNEKLNGFVKEWSLYQGKTWHYLNGGNIDDFIKYLYDKIL